MRCVLPVSLVALLLGSAAGEESAPGSAVQLIRSCVDQSSFLSQDGQPADLSRLATLAVSAEPAEAEAAIAALREAGPAGLEAFFTTHREMLAEVNFVIDPANRNWTRLREALDRVGQQRDCYASRLYWHTDLEQAKRTAKAEGKPILSLRLSGRLTDEYSCANSRFFRTVLYANQDVSRALRERFVLHWSSERPVPHVTIDFGDGRRLERTLTGNSIHYMLDGDGRPIEALPGLYGPSAFLGWLDRSERLASDLASKSETDRAAILAEYHRQRVGVIEAAWKQDLSDLGIELPQTAASDVVVVGSNTANTSNAAAVPAARALPRALTKAVIEAPLLLAISPSAAEVLAEATTGETWQRLAEKHRADAKLDRSSIALIRTQQPAAGRGDAESENRLAAIVESLEVSISRDTVRNEYTLHRRIHEWFATGQMGELTPLNARVYSELFLTPASDPWLGLLTPDVYTGLVNNGVVASETSTPQ